MTKRSNTDKNILENICSFGSKFTLINLSLLTFSPICFAFIEKEPIRINSSVDFPIFSSKIDKNFDFPSGKRNFNKLEKN